MALGLSSSLSKTGLATPGIVTDSLVLKHNYAAGGVVPVSDGAAFFDGTDDYVEIADSDDFSFGDGSTDSAFSISAWVKMVDATDFTIAHKGEFSNDIEWRFGTYGATDDKIKLICGDDSGGTQYIGRKYDATALTSYEGSWIHLAGTYSGSGASSGIKLYLNGVQVDDVNYEGAGASYTAMENQGEPVQIGRYETYYTDGYICNVGLWSRVLTPAEIKSIMWKNYAGLTSSETTNLVSWWNLSADANDNHGSNDGTLT
jgi:hypothetical protein